MQKALAKNLLLILSVFMLFLIPKTICSASSSAAAKTTFKNMEALKAATLTSGAIVTTQGYNSPNDGGGASYTITSSPKYPVDDIYVIQLAHNKYAQMVFSSDSKINVACAGIFPGANISEPLNALIKASVGKVAGIKFNSGDYFIENSITLLSLSYEGADGTNFVVADKYVGKYDKIFLTPSSSGKTYNLVLRNLNFSFLTKKNHPLSNREVVFIALHDIASCTIDNCHVIAAPNDSSGCFVKTDLLWFRFSDNKNINIVNSSFLNAMGLCVPSSDTSHLIGGCLWMAGNKGKSTIKHVNVTNCTFETTVSDEAIALWDGTFRDINFTNCTIHNFARKCDNVLSFYNGSFSGIRFTGTNFISDSPAKYIAKTFSTTAKCDYSFDGCNVQINDHEKNNFAFFLFSQDALGSTLTVNNSNFSTSSDTESKCVVYYSGCTNSQSSFNGCSFDGNYAYGISLLEKSKSVGLKCTSSNINTNTLLLNIKEATNCKLVFDNNTIYSKVTTTVNNSGTLDYSFTNNTICTESPGVLINLNNVSKTNGSSVLTVASNSVELSYFYSNTSVNQNSYIKVQ